MIDEPRVGSVVVGDQDHGPLGVRRPHLGDHGRRRFLRQHAPEAPLAGRQVVERGRADAGGERRAEDPMSP